LTPAPQFPQLWKQAVAASPLLKLIIDGQSRLVRVWATQLLRREHAGWMKEISVADIRRLLDHADETVQMFGAELLETAAGLDKLTVAQWIELLGIRNLTALQTICELMKRHVRPERVTLEQAVAMSVSRPTPVARLGFEFVKGQTISTDAQRDIVAQLATARAATIAGEIAAWALDRTGAQGAYNVDRVARFFDSLTREVRDAAMQWLQPATSGWSDAELWSRLVETPYDDVRLAFVSLLERRKQTATLGPEQLHGVWATVLLGIHRGGRHKLTALRQISDAIRQRPESAESLLPVLAVAIRSVRVPEARAGLSAVVTIISARPELADLVSRHLPELRLRADEVAT
jgi:hypothetical protein